jgi:hypothetical protein
MCQQFYRVARDTPRRGKFPPAVERIIVRRGRYLIFEQLRRTFGRDPNVEIIWDRRRGERDTLTQEQIEERRSRPPVEWERQDYLFTSGGRRAPGAKDKDPQAN